MCSAALIFYDFDPPGGPTVVNFLSSFLCQPVGPQFYAILQKKFKIKTLEFQGNAESVFFPFSSVRFFIVFVFVFLSFSSGDIIVSTWNVFLSFSHRFQHVFNNMSKVWFSLP